jgi:hypothetical protein
MKNIKTANVMLIVVVVLLVTSIAIQWNAHKTETKAFFGKKK